MQSTISRYSSLTYILLCIGFLSISSCVDNSSSDEENTKKQRNKQADVKRVFYLNSYSYDYLEGYQFTRMMENLAEKDKLKMTLYYLNDKPEYTEAQRAKKVEAILKEINWFDPEAIVTLGNPAVQQVIAPHLSKINCSVINMGIHWSDNAYDFPKNRVTNFVNRPRLRWAFSDTGFSTDSFKNIFVLGADNLTNRKATPFLQEEASENNQNISFHWVKSVEEWEITFQEGQKDNTMVVLLDTYGIPNWDIERAKFMASQYTQQPIISFAASTAPCAVLSWVASEQAMACNAMELALVRKPAKTDENFTKQLSVYTKHYNRTLLERIKFEVSAEWLNDAKPTERLP